MQTSRRTIQRPTSATRSRSSFVSSKRRRIATCARKAFTDLIDRHQILVLRNPRKAALGLTVWAAYLKSNGV